MKTCITCKYEYAPQEVCDERINTLVIPILGEEACIESIGLPLEKQEKFLLCWEEKE